MTETTPQTWTDADDTTHRFNNSDGLGELRAVLHAQLVRTLREWWAACDEVENARDDLGDAREDDDSLWEDEAEENLRGAKKKERRLLHRYWAVRRAAAEIVGVPDPVAMNRQSVYQTTAERNLKPRDAKLSERDLARQAAENVTD